MTERTQTTERRGRTPFKVIANRALRRWKTRHDRYHWEPARLGAIPDGAVPQGREANGEPLWVCRARLYNGLHPGKVRPAFGGANIAWNGVEVRVDDYEVLMEAGEWRAAQFGEIPSEASAWGYEATGEGLFVARGPVVGGDLQPGKIRPEFGAANVGYGNLEIKIDSYQILIGS